MWNLPGGGVLALNQRGRRFELRLTGARISPRRGHSVISMVNVQPDSNAAMRRYARISTSLIATLLSVITVASLSGCLLFGAGAAAGAAAGGCALLDENEDDRITREELSAGLYAAWDSNQDAMLSQEEFDAGTSQRDLYQAWSDDFDTWDSDDDAELTRAEFDAGVADDAETEAWLDDQCDDLGL